MFKKELQLEERYKLMIQALVDEHEGRGENDLGDRTQVKDIVANKGKGLVLLLHGQSHVVPLRLINLTDIPRPSWSGKDGNSPNHIAQLGQSY